MIFLLLISLVIINKLIYKSFLNPIFIQSLVWLLYYVILTFNIEVYDVSLNSVNKFLIYQSVGFSLGGFICALFTKSEAITQKKYIDVGIIETTSENVSIFYPLVLILLIGCIIYQIQTVGTFSILEIIEFRKTLADDDGKKSGTIGTLHLLITIFMVIYMATVKWDKTLWYKHLILLFLYFFFTLLLASKGQFVLFFCSLLYLLIWLNKVKKSHIAISILSLAGILFFLLFLGSGGNKGAFTEEAFIDILLIYTVTSLPALFVAESAPSKYFGYYTFRVVFIWLNKLGFTFALAPVLSEFVSTPLPTNVYSYIKPYYQDFGLTGIFWVPFFLGAIHNFFYFKARKGHFVYVIFSCFLIYPLVMQVFEENYFRQLSNWLYIFIIIIILTKIKFRLMGFNKQFNFTS